VLPEYGVIFLKKNAEWGFSVCCAVVSQNSNWLLCT
jgi:hypothetical protein